MLSHVFHLDSFRNIRGSVGREMRQILGRYSDNIEPMSIDEAYVDVTADKRGLGSGTEAARRIRADIWSELGLTASAGVAPVKFVAKIASDFNKPDGLTVVPPSRVLSFLEPLPIEKLPGVGPATARRRSRAPSAPRRASARRR